MNANGGRRRIFALLALLPLLATVHCSDVEDDGDLPGTEKPAVGDALPDWAIATFTHLDVDVTSIRIDSDGTSGLRLSGGDYGGNWSCEGRATVVNGRVQLSAGDTIQQRVDDGKTSYFIGKNDRWRRFERGEHCGRGGGGCGGYDDIEVCTDDELRRSNDLWNACRVAPHDGGRD